MGRARELPAALMGFVWLAVLGVTAAALLRRLGLARPLWSLGGAALMLGATGYALQGRPTLPGAPRAANIRPIEVDPALIGLRGEMFGQFTGDGQYLTIADALLRSGDAGAAVKLLLGGVQHSPGSAPLWTGLGDALDAHDGGQVSPAALLAYRRAIRLAPEHPGPPFFAGLAYVRAGQFAAAQPYWRRALALTPERAPYRAAIATRLGLLEAFLAQGAGAAR